VCYLVLFPIIFILGNNLYLFLWQQKHWKNWLKISNKFDKILNNFELGFAMITMFPFMYLVKLFGKNIIDIIGNINRTIIIIIVGIIGILISILTLKVVKKIFTINEE
jgi:hypothetical protein